MSIMFVRVSTPECAVQITVEQLARAMADERYFDISSECNKLMTTLTKLTSAGFVSDTYFADFVECATRMSKYVQTRYVER